MTALQVRESTDTPGCSKHACPVFFVSITDVDGKVHVQLNRRHGGASVHFSVGQQTNSGNLTANTPLE